MEWFGTLYRRRFSAAAAARIAKTLIVFLVLWAMTAGMSTDMISAADVRPEISAPIAETADGEAARGAAAKADLTWMLSVLPVPDAAEVKEADAVAAVSLSEMEPAVSADPEAADSGKVILPVTPGSDADTIAGTITDRPSDISGSVISGDMENASGADTGEYTEEKPSDPAAAVPPGNPDGTPAKGVVNGFLVNESGVIYGVADPGPAVTDEYMELPSEGCSGIAAGTFAAGFPDVREIFIPSNITYIEEGAFTGLPNMEWYEMESSGNYYTEEGVLFSEGGTCILAFPAGRTGTYKVPSRVVRFASGAFDSAQLDAVDATACSLAETAGIPEDIELLVRKTP